MVIMVVPSGDAPVQESTSQVRFYFRVALKGNTE